MEKKNKIQMKTMENKSEEKKLSYEQLEQVAQNLNNQCKQLYNELVEAKRTLSNFNDIGMLLSIIEVGEHFETSFIDRCTNKIQEVITTMLDDSEKEEQKENK